jgi:hypothetical protein
MSDASDIVGYVGGGAGAVTLLVAGIKWLGGRVVQREDEDKKAHAARLQKAEDANLTTREAIADIKHNMAMMRNSVEQMALQASQRAAAQDKEISELRAEMKEQINQLEHRLRSDMQRLVSPPPTGRRAKT